MEKRESGSRGIHICHHLCSLSISPSRVQTWQQKKEKKRKPYLVYISSPYYHIISHLKSCSNFHVLSSLALLCTLISCEKDFHRRLVVVRSWVGISIRYWLSCTMFRMQMCASAIVDVSERQIRYISPRVPYTCAALHRIRPVGFCAKASVLIFLDATSRRVGSVKS